MKKISIVIPMRNEEGNVEELIGSLKSFLPSLGIDWEAVLVDDLSTDGTLAAAARLAGERVSVLPMPRRVGQAGALQAGFDLSNGDWILTMDADLENDISDLPKLLAGAGEADMVVGGRWRRRSAFMKKAASFLFRVFSWLFFRVGLRDVNSPLRLFKREVVAELRLEGGMHRYLSILALKSGFSVLEVEVSHRPRKSGKTKYPPLSRLWPTIRDFFKVLRAGRK